MVKLHSITLDEFADATEQWWEENHGETICLLPRRISQEDVDELKADGYFPMVVNAWFAPNSDCGCLLGSVLRDKFGLDDTTQWQDPYGIYAYFKNLEGVDLADLTSPFDRLALGTYESEEDRQFLSDTVAEVVSRYRDPNWEINYLTSEKDDNGD